MPHQCLNCGHVIERGSDEILKGCSQCGGKKFMFTSQPMSREKREGIKRRADKVRDKMIRKADPELMNILKEKGMTDIDGSRLEMDSSLGEDWVRYSPEEEEEKIEIDEGTSEVSTEIVGTGKKPSARDLIKEYDMEKKKRKTPQRKRRTSERRKTTKRSKPEAGAEKPAKRVKPKKRPSVPPRRKGTVEKDDVDVINIVEQGVYEIDVEKLLEDGPIVVQKDGSYLLHLPSLFKEQSEKKK